MLRFVFAFILCKLSIFILQLCGKRASHTPGRIALHFCPDYLQYLAKPEHVICVTGTNGKSTVCNMLENALRNHGDTVLDNHFGSNTENGIVSALTKGVSLFNRSVYKNCVLEVDERSSLRVYKNIHPDYLIVVDIFRDSVKRNANPDYITDIISRSVPQDTVLILNADDILCSRICLGKPNKRVYYSVNQMHGEVIDRPNIINDAAYCPNCGGLTEFAFRRYHHIGRMRCPNCGLQSPTPDITAVGIRTADNVLAVMQHGILYRYPLIQSGVHNIYNETAVITLLTELGMQPEEIAGSLKNIKVTDSRYYEKTIGNVRFICHMLKGQNPIAASVVSNYVRSVPGKKTVFMMLDDIIEIAESSENITWYYEADFERLNTPDIQHFYIEGLRAEDMKYRLLLAGVPEEKITTFIGYDKITEIADFTLAPTFIYLFELFYYDEQVKLREKIEEKLRTMGGTAQ